MGFAATLADGWGIAEFAGKSRAAGEIAAFADEVLELLPPAA